MIPDQEKIVKNVWKKNARNEGQNWIFYVPSKDIKFFFSEWIDQEKDGKTSKDRWKKESLPACL